MIFLNPPDTHISVLNVSQMA